MKKEKNEVFFCCVIDGVYKEFNIDVTEKTNELLRREEFYQNKYACAFSLEEQELSLAKKRIANTIRNRKTGNSSSLNLESIKHYSEKLFTYTLELLSNVEFKESFSLPISRMRDYFRGMSHFVRIMPELKDEYESNQDYYETAKKNTMLLSDVSVKMIPSVDEKGKIVGYKMNTANYIQQKNARIEVPMHILIKNKKIS